MLIVLAAPAFAYLSQGYQFITVPYVQENGEGIVLADAQAIYDGVWPYRELKDYPFLVANYPPLYHLLCAGGMWLAGRDSYAPGRIVTLLAMLGIVIATAQIVLRDTGWPAMAWAGGLGILSVSCVARMGPVCRVDMLAASLSFAGLCVTHRQLGKREWVWPVVLFLAAAYTKHSAIAGAAASLAYLWFYDRRKAVKSAALFVGAGIGGVVVLNCATHGRFLRHIVAYTWTRFDVHLIWSYLRGGLRQGLLIFVVSAIGLAWTTVRLARQRQPRQGRGLLFLYLAANAALLVQLGKVGVAYLYVVEFAAAVCMTLPLFVSDLCALAGPRAGWVRAVGLGCILAMLAHVGLAGPAIRGQLAGPAKARPARWVAILKRTQGPVLAEGVGHLITAGKPVLVNPFILSQLGAASRYEYVKTGVRCERVIVPKRRHSDVGAAHDRVLKDVLQGKFAAIQTNSMLDWRKYGHIDPRRWGMARRITDERFSPEWQDAIAQRYRLDRTIGLGAIYVPR